MSLTRHRVLSDVRRVFTLPRDALLRDALLRDAFAIPLPTVVGGEADGRRA